VGITFGQVMKRANDNLNFFLSGKGLVCNKPFVVQILARNSNQCYSVTPDCFFDWEEDYYAWFSVEGIPGGTEAVCQSLSRNPDPANDLSRFVDLVSTKALEISDFPHKLKQVSKLDRRWNFQRSETDDAIADACTVMLATAVAELSDGFLLSSDGNPP
jgi:hypothetical protein